MRYHIERYSPDGNKLDIIQEFTKLTFVRTENEIGSLVLTMPKHYWQQGDWSVNQILEVYREKNGVAGMQGETSYFVQDWEFYSESGQHMVVVYAKDANWILSTRIVNYAAGSTQSEKTDYADDMMKAIVYENFGAGAIASRRLANLTIQADAGKSVSMTKGFSWRNVLEVLKDIAESASEQGTLTYFDVIRTAAATFEFRTYTGQRGMNHGATSGDIRLVGEAYGNLADARIGTYHADEVNSVTAGGQGEEAARVIKTASDSTRIGKGYPFNLREAFFDARADALDDGVQAAAYAALGEGKPRKVLSGRIVDTPGMQYGVDFGFGDIVSVEAFGAVVDCHVSSVGIQFDPKKGEQIDIRLRGEM